jgi:penicillin-binding protein 1A
VVLDAPVVLEGDGMETSWRPNNDGGQFNGPTRLREALYRSRNLVSIRLLRALGTGPAIDYITRFGFSKKDLPSNLTLALGTLQATPLQMATGYSTFANGGYKVEPYYIDRIENAAGEIVYRAAPRIVCTGCEQEASLSTFIDDGTKDDKLAQIDAVRGGTGPLPADQIAARVLTPQNAWLMNDMMRDVVRRGTGRRALALGRTDLAGKTGTTNGPKDTWFNGFTPNLVASVWVGFDQERLLGESEEGSSTALPIWIRYMREALKGVPEAQRPMPEGLVTLRISPDTGMLASGENPDAILETFMTDHLPGAGMSGEGGSTPGAEAGEASGGDPIF